MRARNSAIWPVILAAATAAAACDGSSPPPVPDTAGPTEICNGRDDDGNGACDETHECCAGSFVPCDAGRGVTGWQRCTPDCRIARDEACRPPTEACNGVDDDGDGETDEAPECRGRWLWLNPLPTWASLQAVSLAPDGTALVGGAGGVFAHWDGIQWRPMTSPTTADIRGIDGHGTDFTVAVAADGAILRLGSSGWIPMPLRAPGGLHAVWVHAPGGAAAFALAVGQRGTIMRWNGVNWASMTSGTAEDLWAVWGTGPDEAFAAGAHRTLLRWDGTGWLVEQPFTDQGWLEGVWGSSGHDVYAVGRDGWVLRFDGTTWQRRAVPTTNDLWDVWGRGADDVWVAGDAGTLLHWDGADWTAVDAAAGAAGLRGLDGIAADELWAVGEHGTVVRDRGSGWASLTRGPTDDLEAIVSVPGGGFLAAGSHADSTLNLWTSVVFGSDAGWRAELETTPGQFHDVWAVSPDAAWVVGPGGLVRRYDGSHWTSQTLPVRVDLHAVWGASADDVLVAGAAGTLLRWDGTAWRLDELPVDEDLHAIHGLGPDDVWAAGDAGALVHWDGTSWSSRPTGARIHFRALAAVSPTCVFAVGEQPGTTPGSGTGGVVRWDGSRWHRDEGLFPTPWTGIAALSPTDVYVAAGSAVWHFDGVLWTGLAPTGVGRALTARLFQDLTLDAARRPVTAGHSGSVLRWDPGL
ncbi:MAG: hypothetical protein JXB32_11895 [Deltaproteobacteria bacterium]|nr:hypothetical protein [Deltaproteobacteria bacterium]